MLSFMKENISLVGLHYVSVIIHLYIMLTNKVSKVILAYIEKYTFIVMNTYCIVSLMIDPI